MKSPIITRSSHEAALDALKKESLEREREIHISGARRLRDESDRVDKEIIFLKRELADVIEKLVKVSVVRDWERDSMRCVVDFDPRMMSMALERGNDRKMIKHIGEEISRQVQREIMSCNIQRPGGLGLGRRGGIY